MRYVPIEAHPAQKFETPLEGFPFKFRFNWHPNGEFWTVDCSCADLDYSVTCFRVVTGLDLWHGHGLYQVGKLIFIDLQGQEDPDFENFGSRFKLIHLSRTEVEDGGWA